VVTKVPFRELKQSGTRRSPFRGGFRGTKRGGVSSFSYPGNNK